MQRVQRSGLTRSAAHSLARSLTPRAALLLSLLLVSPGASSSGGGILAQETGSSGGTQASAAGALRQQTVWGDSSVDSLVQRAIDRRGLQLADSSLLSYQAQAHGYLAFLAKLGDGALLPPRVVQSEELALTIAWWQPGRSAQRLVGRRDTTLLPADVGYYRDRYGVVLDNLPDRIRLGDGRDVRDVPHPLAAGASIFYEYRPGDSLSISIPGRDIVVDEVKFRPRDPSQPAAVGSVYLDRETAAVVRLSMTFTRAALLDRRIETLVVTLENGLVEGRYWLPRLQELEVVRGSNWFDIPARGIVRGRWEVSNYNVNERVPAATMMQPRWSAAPLDSQRAWPFTGDVADVLPSEISMASSEDVARARLEAEAAVRAAMLARPTTASVSGRGVGDLARFNKAEGLALGLGGTHRGSHGIQLDARLRYGFADRQLKGEAAVGLASAFGRQPTLQLFAEREYRDLAMPERAGVTNSLASLLFGSDYTALADTRAIGLRWRRSIESAFTWRLAAERDRPTGMPGRSLQGHFTPSIAAWPISGGRLELQGRGGSVGAGLNGARRTWSLRVSAGAYDGHSTEPDASGSPVALQSETGSLAVHPLVVRAEGVLQVLRPLGTSFQLFLRSSAGAVAGRDIPPQWEILAGGPWSGPGYAAQSFVSRALFSQRVELRTSAPAPSLPLGRFGASPPHVTLAPFVQVLGTASGTAGLYPSAGLGVLMFYDLLRVDMARGLRGGTWRFAIDIDQSFWGILQ